MGLPKQLSEQQKKFAELLVYNEGRKTPTECAVEAGYAEGSASVRASELRNANKFPLVVKYIGELRAEVQKKYEVTFERHVTELGRIREQALAKGAFSAAANAEVARGKAAGLYIEQRISLTGKLEDLSLEELELKMKKIFLLRIFLTRWVNLYWKLIRKSKKIRLLFCRNSNPKKINSEKL